MNNRTLGGFAPGGRRGMLAVLLGASLGFALLAPPSLAVAGGFDASGNGSYQDQPTVRPAGAEDTGSDEPAYETPEQQLAAAQETRQREEAQQLAEEERQQALADQEVLAGLAATLGAGAAKLDDAAVQEARKAAGTELSPDEESQAQQQELAAANSSAFGCGVTGMAGACAVIGAALLAKGCSKGARKTK